jgi:predicted DNA-binding ribbon-helix-helix protein
MQGYLSPHQNSGHFQKPRAPSKSPIIKRSIVIGGHKTSVSLEDAFWTDLREIAYESRVTLSSLVAGIDKARAPSNLSSAIRLFVLEHWHNRSRT